MVPRPFKIGNEQKPTFVQENQVRARRAAFFYMRPAVAPPMSNRCLVALTGTVLGFLTTPPHPAQQMPEGIGMIVNLKLFANYPGDPLKGPQLDWVPRRLGTAQ